MYLGDIVSLYLHLNVNVNIKYVVNVLAFDTVKNIQVLYCL